MIEDLAGKEGGEDFKTFWEAFGRNIKVRRKDAAMEGSSSQISYVWVAGWEKG